MISDPQSADWATAQSFSKKTCAFMIIIQFKSKEGFLRVQVNILEQNIALETASLHLALKLLKILVFSNHFISSHFPSTFIQAFELVKTHYFFIEYTRVPLGTFNLKPVCCLTKVAFLGCFS